MLTGTHVSDKYEVQLQGAKYSCEVQMLPPLPPLPPPVLSILTEKASVGAAPRQQRAACPHAQVVPASPLPHRGASPQGLLVAIRTAIRAAIRAATAAVASRIS
eukprot:CAMPEP_0181184076 /NCGR_PEP_ID=MMETSP1096-20121128/8771_1 /TAXON_ID=156174 ORGANISM="Chrysochromulina ericina, Strain CCMP281" /NCGR_SAMPLE_ID=MMETSP1096 /ASSEMBLY_ACC=CAM_ASM_000453 /LENGTH=103 /DNA_ID=CAMNT_0023272809 /DNA_START=670 /DNA_END=982 /DNA_ORIENTATION=+